jgi:polyphosphate kinase 2 (PPK2 family)
MGFCTPQELALFLRQTPIFEQMLTEDGILLRKYWFSVSEDEQLRRFKARLNDPVRQWKLSPMDLESLYRWEDYSRAKDETARLSGGQRRLSAATARAVDRRRRLCRNTDGSDRVTVS